MKKILVITLLIFVACAGVTTADDVIKMKRGVEFPHKFHQETLKDCTKCHGNEPPGKIAGFGRDWAHKNCRVCHTSRNPRTACHDCHKL